MVTEMWKIWANIYTHRWNVLQELWGKNNIQKYVFEIKQTLTKPLE